MAPAHVNRNLKAFWQKSGSFTNRRLSLVPSFKTQIGVYGDEAWLYFECHDIGDFDQPSRAFAADVFLAGIVRRVGGHWVFWRMVPFSLSTYTRIRPGLT